MFFVFRLDIGSMIQVRNVALFTVASFQQVIAEQTCIPIDQQVLLTREGKPLIGHEIVCKYKADNSEKNPIFLFSKESVDSLPPPVTQDSCDAIQMAAEVNSSISLPDAHSTIAARILLAQQLDNISREEFKLCERLINQQHLQNQGWNAVLSNLEDIITDLERRRENFVKMHDIHLATWEESMTILKNFDDDLFILQKLPVLPSLLDNTDGLRSPSAFTVMDEPSSALHTSLLDWIQKEKDCNLKQTAKACFQFLEHLNPDLLDQILTNIKDCVEVLSHQNSKQLRDLGHNLENLKLDIENVGQKENINERSDLSSLIPRNKEHLRFLMKKLEHILTFKKVCLQAKEQLWYHLHTRLKYVGYVQGRILECNRNIKLYHNKLIILNDMMEIITQSHNAPSMYGSAIVEVIRRTEFSQDCVQKMKHFKKIVEEEVKNRTSFLSGFRKHFLFTLFPGMEDIPPSFVSEVTHPYDESLPNITIQDLQKFQANFPGLMESLPDTTKETLKCLLTKYKAVSGVNEIQRIISTVGSSSVPIPTALPIGSSSTSTLKSVLTSQDCTIKSDEPEIVVKRKQRQVQKNRNLRAVRKDSIANGTFKDVSTGASMDNLTFISSTNMVFEEASLVTNNLGRIKEELAVEENPTDNEDINDHDAVSDHQHEKSTPVSVSALDNEIKTTPDNLKDWNIVDDDNLEIFAKDKSKEVRLSLPSSGELSQELIAIEESQNSTTLSCDLNDKYSQNRNQTMVNDCAYKKSNDILDSIDEDESHRKVTSNKIEDSLQMCSKSNSIKGSKKQKIELKQNVRNQIKNQCQEEIKLSWPSSSDLSQKSVANKKEIKEEIHMKLKPDMLQISLDSSDSIFTPNQSPTTGAVLTSSKSKDLFVSLHEHEPNKKRKLSAMENAPEAQLTLNEIENSPQISPVGSIGERQNIEVKNEVDKITNISEDSQPSDFESCSIEILEQLCFMLGAGLHKRLSQETKEYRDMDKSEFKDDVVFNLQNKKITPILSFFHGITGKSIFNCDEEDNTKIQKFACNFYETAQKATNLTILPPQAYGASERFVTKSGYEALRHANKSLGAVGGSRQTHSNNLNLNPIEPAHDGGLVIDNIQFGVGKMQHNDTFRLDRKTPCQVFTNVVKVILPDGLSENGNIFSKVENLPCQFEVHPLFAPAGEEFAEVMENRLKSDLSYGHEAQKNIVEHVLGELQDERNRNGETTIEKHLEDIIKKCPRQNFYCRKCGVGRVYTPDKDNVCECGYNASYYDDNESGPYLKYNIPHGPQREAKVLIQEPQNIAPNSINNLAVLYETFPTCFPKEHLSYLLAADAVPAILYGRMMHDHIYCSTHKKLIKLSDQSELLLHYHPDCFIQWPFPNIHRIVGDSHEEIFINLLALSVGSNFGLLEFLEALGKKSKNSQLQAMRTRQLHDLYALNFQWTMSNLKALGLPYIKSLPKDVKPTRNGFFTFATQSKDQKYIARFNAVMKVNLPAIIKRLGNRLNNINVSNGASAMCALVSMSFPSTFYRDHYFFKYANGKKHTSQEKLKPLPPRRLDDFLSEKQKKSLKVGVGGPGYASYQPRIPTIGSELLEVLDNHRLVSTNGDLGTSEGVDFKQEARVGDIVKQVPKKVILTIGFNNFKKFSKERLKGIPCSAIKLRPAHITVKKQEEFDHISSRTIEEIKLKINSLLDKSVDCNDYEEIKRKIHSKTTRKPDLINIYIDLEERQKAMKLTEEESDV